MRRNRPRQEGREGEAPRGFVWNSVLMPNTILPQAQMVAPNLTAQGIQNAVRALERLELQRGIVMTDAMGRALMGDPATGRLAVVQHQHEPVFL